MRLEVANSIRQGHHRRERKQQVNVVCRPAGRKQTDVLGLRDDGEPFPESFGVANLILSFLRAEDAVNQVAGQGVRHDPMLRTGHRSFCDTYTPAT